MKQNHPSIHFGKIIGLIVFVAVAFSMLGAPATSPVVAQEPTPTADGDVSGQIVGGGPADPGEWPWQVALIDGSYGGTDYWPSQFCGGSLITPQWVLTAAHCVVVSGNPIPASAVDVVAGVYDLTNSSGSQRRDVTQIIVHPSYAFPYNDIALLKLASPVTIGGTGASKTAVVPLVSASIDDLATEMSWVTGWGNTESSPAFPEELYEVEVPIITNDLCNLSYGGIVPSMLCAGYEDGGKDACQGDSGGPLVVSVGGNWQLAGIVSTGYGCADPYYYGIYTRVSSFTSWVESNVPDLAVSSILIQSPDVDLDSTIYVNDDVFVYIDVQNVSVAASGPFVVNLYIDDTLVSCSNTNRDYHFNSSGLAGGASENLALTIPAGSLTAAAHSITAYADSGCGISEINEANNILTVGFTVNPIPVAAPVHDNVENAKEVTTLPYTDTVNVRGATRHATDPTNISCTLSDGTPVNRIAGLASVWYQYTATANTTIAVDTFGSNYDTYIAAWQGLPDTTHLGCNDDSGGVFQSYLALNVTSGTTYYFEVAQYSNDITNVTAASLDGKSSPDVEAQAGGNLSFRVREGANVDVTIGGSLMGSYPVPPSTSIRDQYIDINSGPVKFIATNGMPIVASARVAYTPDGGTTWTNYSELMGMPDSQLTDNYWFPFYNSLQLNTFLSVSNVGNADTTVTITIGGVEVDSYVLEPSGSQKKIYPGLNTGPVKVQSTGGVPIITSERVSYSPGGNTTFTSFSELMGMPDGQLTDTYWFPFYNSLQLNTFLSVSNVGNADTTVTITIGGNLVDSYVLAPNGSQKKNYPGLNTGPVKVQSTGGVPIITSERISYSPGGNTTFTSFSELMGMPDGQLTDTNWFPWYDSIQHSTFLSVSNVGNTDTTVTITIGGVQVDSYVLAPSGSQKKKYPGLNTGPVKVQSSSGVPIITSERVSYSPGGNTIFTSFSEMLGLPADLLTTTFWLPFYNSLQLDSEVRFGTP
jgi:hypothetical protein